MNTIYASSYDSAMNLFKKTNKVRSILKAKQLHILCTALILINSLSVNAQTDAAGSSAIPANIISLGGGMNLNSGNGPDANLGKSGYGFQLNYFRSLWAKEIVSLGVNLSGDYSVSSIGTDGLQKYKPLQINGSSAPETDYKNQKLTDPAMRIGLGPQLNFHLGRNFMISQMLNVTYVNQTIEGRTVTQSSVIREQPFTKDIYTQPERKISGMGFLPKLRFQYLFGNMGVWLEGNYAINPKFTAENNVFLPTGALSSDGTVPDRTYDLKEIESGSYYTTNKTVVNNQVGVFAGISYSFGVSKKNQTNTAGRQQGQDFNTTRNNKERGQFATNPSGGDSANPANTANRQQAQDFNTTRSNRERGQLATNPNTTDQNNKDDCSALRDENNEKKETINIITLEPVSFSLISNNVKKSGKDYSAQDIKNPPTEGYNPWEMEETIESPLLIPLTSNQEEISAAEPKSKKNNPTYDASGNSGNNPLYEGKTFQANPGGSVVSTVVHSLTYSNEGIFTTDEKGQKAMAVVPVQFSLKIDKKASEKHLNNESIPSDRTSKDEAISNLTVNQSTDVIVNANLLSDSDLKQLLYNNSASSNDRKFSGSKENAIVTLSDNIIKTGIGIYHVRGIMSVDGIQYPVIVHFKTKPQTAKNSISNIR